MLHIAYLASFFYALHYSLTIYIESSFLSQFFPERIIGAIYVAGAVLSIVGAINIPSFLARYGNYKIIIFLVFAELISLFGLALASTPGMALGLFILHQALITLIFISLNIFIESLTSDASTGRTRGVLLTIINSAILFGPLIAGGFLEDSNFGIIFILAIAFLLPVLLLVSINFKNHRDPSYEKVAFLKTAIEVIKRKEVYRIVTSRFLLEFFYAVMVVYTPIYLNKHMGIPFSDILGIIMPVALSPFVILPYIIGGIADKKLGEKEMLILGIVIISAGTMSLSFVTSASVITWTVLLLITRIGASLIESMSDTYFFKHVNASESGLIAFYGNLRSIALIVGPIFASMLLLVADIRYMFLALGIIMFFGIKHGLALKDTL